MIEMVLAHVDLARVRFAHSPARELVASLLVLQDPARQPMHGRWLLAARRRLDGVELELLTALVPPGRYLPSFLLPASTRPWVTLAEDLEVIAASPPAVVRAELDKVRDGRPLRPVLRPLYADPAAHLPEVVAALGRYWQAVLEPYWPRLRALSAADVTFRMEQFANGGLAHVLAGLHPGVALDADRLRIDKPHHCSHRFDLAGTGILLMPCAFIWPTVAVECCTVDQPSLTYPTRGVAELWQDAPADQTDPLSALVGKTRAVGHPWATQNHHPAGRPARPQPTRGQPAPQGPQGRRLGHRPPPRADGALPANTGRLHPAERHPDLRASRLSIRDRPPA